METENRSTESDSGKATAEEPSTLLVPGQPGEANKQTTPEVDKASASLNEPIDPTSNPQNQPALQVDENLEDESDERDSAYNSGTASTSASLGSSITNYQYENGRRYHAYREGEYYMPNDEDEQARLDLQHHIWRLCLGGSLYLAPIKDPQSILDIGTATGIWPIDLSDEFPSALVIGTDLSPIQPNFTPPNVKFYVDDFESQWDFSEVGAFDFIHWRSLGGSTGDFPKLYGQAMRELKPGGYLEVHEYDADIYSDDDPKSKYHSFCPPLRLTMWSPCCLEIAWLTFYSGEGEMDQISVRDLRGSEHIFRKDVKRRSIPEAMDDRCRIPRR